MKCGKKQSAAQENNIEGVGDTHVSRKASKEYVGTDSDQRSPNKPQHDVDWSEEAHERPMATPLSHNEGRKAASQLASVNGVAGCCVANVNHASVLCLSVFATFAFVLFQSQMVFGSGLESEHVFEWGC